MDRAARNAEIVGLYSAGESAAAIGRRFDLTRQAILKIAVQAGVFVQRRRTVYGAFDWDAEGVPVELRPLLERNGAVKAFRIQRNNAIKRNVPWRMTLAEWWAIWETSGKFEQRGREVGKYVMGRHGDAGPYAVGNVSIILASQNCSDGHQVRRRRKARWDHILKAA